MAVLGATGVAVIGQVNGTFTVADAGQSTTRRASAGFTCSINAGVIPLVKLRSPPFFAVTVCEPPLKVPLTLTLLAAAIPKAFSAAVPRTAVPSRNVTDPVGVPEPGAVAVTGTVRSEERR